MKLIRGITATLLFAQAISIATATRAFGEQPTTPITNPITAAAANMSNSLRPGTKLPGTSHGFSTGLSSRYTTESLANSSAALGKLAGSTDSKEAPLTSGDVFKSDLEHHDVHSVIGDLNVVWSRCRKLNEKDGEEAIKTCFVNTVLEALPNPPRQLETFLNAFASSRLNGAVLELPRIEAEAKASSIDVVARARAAAHAYRRSVYKDIGEITSTAAATTQGALSEEIKNPELDEKFFKLELTTVRKGGIVDAPLREKLTKQLELLVHDNPHSAAGHYLASITLHDMHHTTGATDRARAGDRELVTDEMYTAAKRREDRREALTGQLFRIVDQVVQTKPDGTIDLRPPGPELERQQRALRTFLDANHLSIADYNTMAETWKGTPIAAGSPYGNRQEIKDAGQAMRVALLERNPNGNGYRLPVTRATNPNGTPVAGAAAVPVSHPSQVAQVLNNLTSPPPGSVTGQPPNLAFTDTLGGNGVAQTPTGTGTTTTPSNGGTGASTVAAAPKPATPPTGTSAISTTPSAEHPAGETSPVAGNGVQLAAASPPNLGEVGVSGFNGGSGVATRAINARPGVRPGKPLGLTASIRGNGLSGGPLFAAVGAGAGSGLTPPDPNKTEPLTTTPIATVASANLPALAPAPIYAGSAAAGGIVNAPASQPTALSGESAFYKRIREIVAPIYSGARFETENTGKRAAIDPESVLGRRFDKPALDGKPVVAQKPKATKTFKETWKENGAVVVRETTKTPDGEEVAVVTTRLESDPPKKKVDSVIKGDGEITEAIVECAYDFSKKECQPGYDEVDKKFNLDGSMTQQASIHVLPRKGGFEKTNEIEVWDHGRLVGLTLVAEQLDGQMNVLDSHTTPLDPKTRKPYPAGAMLASSGKVSAPAPKVPAASTAAVAQTTMPDRSPASEVPSLPIPQASTAVAVKSKVQPWRPKGLFPDIASTGNQAL